jgi:uracil-DNA glycosylase family 4
MQWHPNGGHCLLSKPSTCTGCVLHDLGSGFLHQEILPPSNGVLLVGEAPGETEAETGYPFTGKAGDTLNKCIGKAGLKREDFAIYNVLSCRPPENKLNGVWYADAAISHCDVNLSAVVRRTTPRVILALGSVAARTLIPDLPVGILDACGYVFWSKRYNCWVIPTVHPSFILRGKTSWAQVLIFCLQKAVQIAEEGYSYAEVDYTLDCTPKRAMEWVDEFERYYVDHEGLYLSTDIETPDKDADEEGLELDPNEDADEIEAIEAKLTHTILRCGYSYKSHHALSIPWDGNFRAVHERLLKHPSQKLFWNGSFDCPRIRSNDVQINGPIHDAMDAWHVLNSDLKKKLGFVTPFFCFDQPMWKHMSNERPAYYNAVDADAAGRNMAGTAQLLKQNGIWDVYKEFVQGLDPVFSSMSAAGMPVSRVARAESAKLLTNIFDKNRATIDALLPLELHPFHPKTGYTKTPDDTTGMRELVFDGITVKRCSGCGLKNPTKPHFKLYKKKDNPCAGCSAVTALEGERRWAKVDPFVPSTKGILRYQLHMKHQVIMTGRGKDRKPTTDKKAIKKLIGKYPNDGFYPLVVVDRDVTKIGGTYIGWWDEAENKITGGFPVGRDGRVHGTFRNTPSTLRTSMVSPNLQNLPRGGSSADDIQRLVKAMFVASAGNTFVARDFSGIEAQLVGVHANDRDFLRLAKVDIHSYFTAHNLYRLGKIPFADVPQLNWSDKDIADYGKQVIKARFNTERDIGKRCIHAGNYRVGPTKLQEEYPEWFSKVKEAAAVLSYFYEVFPSINKWHERICRQVDKDTIYRNSFGHIHRFYSVLKWERVNGEWDWSYDDDSKRLIAFGPQSDAAFIGRLALKRVFNNYPDTVGRWLRLFIHDELFCEAPEHRAEECDMVLKFEMEKQIEAIPLPDSWGFGRYLSIESEGKVGNCWATMKKL